MNELLTFELRRDEESLEIYMNKKSRQELIESLEYLFPDRQRNNIVYLTPEWGEEEPLTFEKQGYHTHLMTMVKLWIWKSIHENDKKNTEKKLISFEYDSGRYDFKNHSGFRYSLDLHLSFAGRAEFVNILKALPEDKDNHITLTAENGMLSPLSAKQGMENQIWIPKVTIFMRKD
jgi:hypothetical protein